MDTSKKTEITKIVEGTAEVESAGNQPPISASKKTLVPGEERINQSSEVSSRAVSLARDRKRGGPRTARGKRRSGANARKHAIFSQVTLLEGEPRKEFDYLLRGLRNHLEPDGPLEEVLIDKLVSLLWRYRRLIIAEGERKKKDIFDFNLGADTLSVELSLRYESGLDRAVDRVLSQLERLQRLRKGQPMPPTLNVSLD